MRTLVVLLMLTCVSVLVNAQGINFQQLNYKEALAKAKAENKSVFVDCYTVWCGPCKYMADNIFVLKEVGDYFNQNFISIKFDMESDAAEEFRNMYYVYSYPTFFFINKDGEVINRRNSSRSAEVWLKETKATMSNPNSLDKLKKKYLNSKTDANYSTYLEALKKTEYQEGLKDLLLTKFELSENKLDFLMGNKGLLSTSLSKVNFGKFKTELKTKKGYSPEMEYILKDIVIN